MKQFCIFSVLGSFVLACFVLPTATTAHTTEGDGDWSKCEEGSDLFDPPECPGADPEHPVYFPFPYNCYQYYECTNGIGRCIHCAPGTIWDQENLICNHPANVNCTIITTTTPLPTTTVTTTTPEPTTEQPTTEEATTEEPTTEEPTTEEPTTEEPTTEEPTTEEPTTLPPPTTQPPVTTTEDPINWICPEGYIGLMRHPYDCRLFYNCDPGRRPCIFECQSGLFFNPVIGACDFPFNIPDCIDGTPPPTSTTPSSMLYGSSLNYRNVNRFNFAQNVQFVANLIRRKDAGSQDPCAGIKTYLGV